MDVEIGEAAGAVWRYLEQHGEATLAKVKQGTKLPDPLVHMAVGWLAREGKVRLAKDARSVRLALRAES